MTITEQPALLQAERQTSQFRIDTWNPSDIPSIANLEAATWAPWLRKPIKHFTTIAHRFSRIQFLARDHEKNLVATLTTNRINWDGNSSSLTTWDDVAGGSIKLSDYSTTYTPNGNTLCLMSMDVNPGLHGVAPQLLTAAKDTAEELGIQHIISSFRPSGYGDFKLAHGLIDFETYCTMEDVNGEPIDPWLRSVSRQGMKPLRVEPRSMVVMVDRKTFEGYQKTYNPDKWKRIEDGTWECGEAGNWQVIDNHAIYTEPNLWGEIPLLTHLTQPR